jgi:tetratricopeptide (TPR) repeat protein
MPTPSTPSRGRGISPELTEPESFAAGRYAVQRFLGEGGKKRVYLVHDTKLDREVAFSLIKTEGLDAVGVERIVREARLMGKLGSHPHVVSLFDIGEEADQPYLVSELMGGGDVEGLIAKAPEHRVPLEAALRIADEVCQALAYAHGHGIVHRDLKPGNVWLTPEGTAKLGDFGLAVALAQTRLTAAGMIVGTVAYLPPEQALGQPPDARSDLYSLGAMLYELVTGQPPFVGGDPVAVISQHVHTPPVAPSWHVRDLPKSLEALILRLLEKDPAKRPPSAEAVRAEMAAIQASAAPLPTSEPRRLEEAVNPLDQLAGGVFVGRERELEMLRTALEGALSGQGKVSLLAGEPGIGKTRLAEELATYAALRGCRVLWGRCHEWEGAPAYWPWVQALRAYVHDRDPQQLRTELGAGAAEIAQVISEIRERLPDLPALPAAEPEAARFRLFDAVATFLRNASSHQPLILALDDLHWSDKPSLLLLEYVARELGRARALIIGTYRDVEVGRRHPLSQTLAELARTPHSQRLLLRGLTPAEVERYVALTTGAEPAPELVATIHRETEGNPFFVAEVVRLLAAEGRLTRVTPGRSWSVGIPESVRDVVGRRLERLSEGCNELLTTAAIIGREFNQPVLERVTGVPTDDVLDALEEAVQARLIQEGGVGRYRFTHALVQETLAEEVGAARRARLHRRVGEALEGLHAGDPGPYLTELAHHFLQAAPAGTVDKAIAYAQRAAERAAAQVAWEEAVGHYERALAVLELAEPTDERHRLALVLALSEAQFLAAADQARATLRQAIELARQLGEAEQFARAVVNPAWGIGADTVDSEQIERLEEALASLPSEDSALRARVLSKLAIALYYVPGSHERRLALCVEAVAMAQRLDDASALAWTLVARQRALHGPDTLEERIADTAESLRLSTANQDPAGLFTSPIARYWLLHHYLEQGDLAAVEREFETMARLMGPSRLAADQWMLNDLRTLRALMAGRFSEAEALIEQGRVREVALPAQSVAHHAVRQLLMIRREQGRLPEMETQIGGLVEANPTIPHWRCQLAWLYADSGRPTDAGRLVEHLAADGFADLPRDDYYITNLALLAEVSAAIGEVTWAAALSAQLVPFAGRNVTPGSGAMCYGSASHYLGLLATTLGRWSDAERHFEAALDLNIRLQAPPFVARTQFAYAEMLVRREEPGDRERALKLVGEVLETAEELGMRRLAEQALALKVEVQGILKA